MTAILLATAFIILTALPCYLYRQVNITQRILNESEQARGELEKQLSISSSGLESYIPKMKVMVEIDDPIELARREKPLTKYLSQVAPELIIKKVYEQIAYELEAGLKEKNVNATVTVDKHYV